MEWSALILISVFFVLLLLNVPISFCIGLATLCTMLLSMDLLPAVTTLAQRMAGGLNSFALLAIPFFVLAGELMNAGGISRRIVNVAGAWVGHFKGGLGYVAIFACVIMASLSGSAIADMVDWPGTSTRAVG